MITAVEALGPIAAKLPAAASQELPPRTRTLAQLQKGKQARIEHDGLGAGDVEYLTALGLGAGRTVSVCRPGAPCIVRVGSARIGLAAAIAKHILVEELPA